MLRKNPEKEFQRHDTMRICHEEKDNQKAARRDGRKALLNLNNSMRTNTCKDDDAIIQTNLSKTFDLVRMN